MQNKTYAGPLGAPLQEERIFFTARETVEKTNQTCRRLENDVLRMHLVKTGPGDLLAVALLVTDKGKEGWSACRSKGEIVKDIRALAPRLWKRRCPPLMHPSCPINSHEGQRGNLACHVV